MTVAALVDADESRCRIAGRNFRHAVVSDRLDQALEQSQPSLTLITSPPPQHIGHARAALAVGSHVLCEKPIAGNTQDAQAMVCLAEQARRTLAVGQTRRFYPCINAARQLLKAGRIGSVRSYDYVEGTRYAWPVASAAPFRRDTSGGGALLDKGVHALDTLCWLFGPAAVLSHRDDALGGGVESLSVTELDHDGITGRLVLAWGEELANGFLIRGDKGDLWMPTGPLHDLFLRLPGRGWERLCAAADFPADVTGSRRRTPRIYYDCFDLQLVQTLRAILHGEAGPVGPREALVALEVIEAAYARAEPVEQPWLTPAEQDHARRNHWRGKPALSVHGEMPREAT